MKHNYQHFIDLVEYGIFRVTRNGDVYRYDGRKVGHKQGGFIVLSSFYNNNGKRKTIRVYLHKLVYLLYVGPVPDCHIVEFINGNKDDCRADNLKLISTSAHSKMRFNKIELSRYRFSLDDLSRIRKLRQDGVEVQDIADEYGVRRYVIHRILAGATYSQFKTIDTIPSKI